MLCPVCKSVHLTMAERSGIEIDFCPQCRGVWLDRGELDKIIDRSGPQAARSTRPGRAPLSSPSSSTRTPLTQTWRTPAACCAGRR